MSPILRASFASACLSHSHQGKETLWVLSRSLDFNVMPTINMQHANSNASYDEIFSVVCDTLEKVYHVRAS